MPIFIPFGFRQQPKVEPAPPAWSPADFTNVQYWWTADAGITESGTGVSQWRDQINNFDLIQGTDANRPSLTTSSNLNGQNVVSFNGTSDYLYTAAAPGALSGNDVTMLAVFDFVDPATAGTIMGVSIFATATRFWLDTVSDNFRVVSQNIVSTAVSTTNIATAPVATGNHFVKLRYDASAGDGFYALNTLTESSLGTGGPTNSDWPVSSTVAMGAGVNNNGGTVFGGRYVEYKMAEEVFIYGTPTTDEMNDWKSYVNTKYGTVIS